MKTLTTSQVAEFCHVTHRCVLQWIEEGKIKSFKTPGGHNRVNVEDFVAFLNKFSMPIPDSLREYEKKKAVLIVDDDENMVKAIIRIIKSEGKYEVEYAYNGFEAGRKVGEFRPDLIVLDIKMPGMDGYEVTRMLKAEEKYKDIKIIVISGYFEQEGKEKILSYGADACLDKPFEKEEFLSLLGKLVG